MSPYEILGVRPEVPFPEIKQAFRRAVLRYHPDTAPGGGNPIRFRQVTEAYEELQRTHPRHLTAAAEPPPPEPEPPQSVWAPVQDEPRYSPLADAETVRLTLEELINCIEYSENRYVRQVAMESIAMKREREGLDYLIARLEKVPASEQCHIIRALGQQGLDQVCSVLMPYVSQEPIEISAAAIQALERIALTNRQRVIDRLRQETTTSRERLLTPWRKLRELVTGPPPNSGNLGEILVRTRKINRDQLEVALLLQKRFPLLLGQIIRHLEYLTIAEIQQAISLQRSVQYY